VALRTLALTRMSLAFIRIEEGLDIIIIIMALQPFVGPWSLFSSLILYTVGRTFCTGDQPVARPLPTHRTTQTQNKRTHRHICVEWDSSPRSQRSRERKQFMI
jgi:hypothetical protein